MKRPRVTAFVLHAGLGIAALLWIAPIWLMVVFSTHTPDALFQTPAPFWPSDQFGVNFASLEARAHFLGSIWNSIRISGLFTIGSLAVTTLAGYAFWRFDTRPVRIVFLSLLLTLAVPNIALVLPQYVMVARDFGLRNTTAGVLLPYLANAVGIFFMRQMFFSIPVDIIDAARIDGAGEFRIFRRIALPLVVPGMAALSIILFLSVWTDYLWPLLMLADPTQQTAPVALGQLLGGYNVNFAIVMTGAVAVTVPFIVLFLFLQRFLISGITAGAVK